MNIRERFFSKVSPEALTGCWLWTGSYASGGYGQLYSGRRTPAGHPLPMRATHVSWFLHTGEEVGELFACHICDNPACVAPHHLFLGTQKDNQEDMAKKKRGRNHNTGKTHCKQGHELSGDNVYLYKGERHCKACNRVAALAAYHRKQGNTK